MRDLQPGPLDYEDLYHRAPAGYLITLDDGTVVSANDAFLRATGHELYSLAGRNLSELMSADDWSNYLALGGLRSTDQRSIAGVGVDLLGSDGAGHAMLLFVSRTADTPPLVRVVVAGAAGRGEATGGFTSTGSGLLSELHEGIDNDDLRLYYQPRMDLGTGQLHGVEALVRWEHEVHGLLPPSEFLRAAEESSLIYRIGAWVLEEAVRQAASWNYALADRSLIEMAVNLSARQLADPGLVRQIADVLGKHGVPPGLLTLEITETALIHDPDTALGILTDLKMLGVKLALDDFGTGYSSLAHLRRFPIDEIKIDRSFIAGVERNAKDSAIVSGCVELAHALGIRVVAEGVETDSQRRALLDMGCDYAQGFHYTQPLTAGQIATWAKDFHGR